MEIDAYTKIMLTVIALCLIFICLKHMKSRSSAMSLSGLQPEPDNHPIGFTALPFVTQ